MYRNRKKVEKIAKYTITIKTLLDNGFDLGLKDYPIFNEEYREILNNAIIEHYYFREIGYSNPAVWRHRLNARMRRIMRDKYNKLYESKAIEFNPLYNIDITETFEREVAKDSNTSTTESGTNKKTDTFSNTDVSSSNTTVDNKTTDSSLTEATSDTSESSHSLTASSQYPNEQIALGTIGATTNIDAATINDTTSSSDSGTTTSVDATNTQHGTSNTSGDVTSNGTTDSNGSTSSTGSIDTDEGETESYVRTTKGSSAGLPFSKAMLQLKEFLDQFDLDAQVISELSDLFMTIW